MLELVVKATIDIDAKSNKREVNDMIKRFMNDESGQGMTEYILIVALIAVAAIAAVKLFGTQITGLFTSSKDKIANATQ